MSQADPVIIDALGKRYNVSNLAGATFQDHDGYLFSIGGGTPAVNADTGAHTITAAEFASQEYIANGLTADASHTTPVAADVIASGVKMWAVTNPTAFTLTILGGTGVTFSGSAVVDSSTRVTYLVGGTAAAATLTRLPMTVGVGA